MRLAMWELVLPQQKNKGHAVHALKFYGGDEGARTHDLTDVNRAL